MYSFSEPTEWQVTRFDQIASIAFFWHTKLTLGCEVQLQRIDETSVRLIWSSDWISLRCRRVSLPNDTFSLKTFGALNDVEDDFLTLLEGFVTIFLD
jgi:hypothetical protein